MVDDKKQIKEFINYICDSVEYNFRVNGHVGFSYKLCNDRLSYLISDKGIEKRIKLKLLKELGLRSRVFYEITPSANLYLDGEISVTLNIKEEINYDLFRKSLKLF